MTDGPASRTELGPNQVDAWPTKRLFIEIKSTHEILPHLADALAKSGLAARQIVIIAFDFAVIASARRAFDRYEMTLLCRTRWKPRAWRWGRALGRFLARAQRARLDALGTDPARTYLLGDSDSAGAGEVRRVGRAG